MDLIKTGEALNKLELLALDLSDNGQEGECTELMEVYHVFQDLMQEAHNLDKFKANHTALIESIRSNNDVLTGLLKLLI